MAIRLDQAFGVIQIIAGIGVLVLLLPFQTRVRRAGFRRRPLGWISTLVIAMAGPAMLLLGVSHLTQTALPIVIRETAVGLSITMIPFVMGVIPAKWLLRSRSEVRDRIAQGNALLELGRRAPENGTRAFEKAHVLYSSALADAPESFAATYGCGLALFELAQMTESPAREDLIDRALHWFARAVSLDPKPELRTFVSEIEEYRPSLRGA